MWLTDVSVILYVQLSSLKILDRRLSLVLFVKEIKYQYLKKTKIAIGHSKKRQSKHLILFRPSMMIAISGSLGKLTSFVFKSKYAWELLYDFYHQTRFS